MQKVKQNYVAEFIVAGAVAMALLTSCEVGTKSNAMPAVHPLYNEFSEEEKGVYNTLNAKDREVINRNTEIYQLRQALDTNFHYDW
tara:strand:+ start:1666 stop:1923 length:258 start_codon:yes stop_codon:yes gene_type:complete